MSIEPNVLDDPTSSEWPYCPALDATCLVVDCVGAMGQGIVETMLTFIKGAEDGSRLTLQKNRDGFTAQVTKAVQKGHIGAQVDIGGLRALRAKLNQLNPRGSSG